MAKLLLACRYLRNVRSTKWLQLEHTMHNSPTERMRDVLMLHLT
jgi:hypothetical protein